MPYPAFVNGTAAQAPQVNANFAALQNCANAIDFNNIGTSGIYASQVKPGSTAQATFGGSSPYTLPSGLLVNGNVNGGAITTAETDGQSALIYPSNSGVSRTAISESVSAGYNYFGVAKLEPNNAFDVWLLGIDASGNLNIPNGGGIFAGPVIGTAGQFSGAVTGASYAGGTVSGTTGSFTGVVNSRATYSQTTGSTYTIPYDAQSVSGSSNTHLEHGDLSVSNIGLATLSCNSPYNVTFTKAYTAVPTITLTTSAISGRGQYTTAHVTASSTTGFTAEICNPTSAGQNTPSFLSWIALGE